jgi:phenylalanyl-tRNA synthetase alpha chain
MPLKTKITHIRKSFLEDLKNVRESKQFEEIKIRYLGKKGLIALLMVELKNCLPEERPAYGLLINELKQEITKDLDSALQSLIDIEQKSLLEKQKIDITLPGRRNFLGNLHPVTKMMDKMLDVFVSMSFSVQYGPDLESDYYNFEALNFEPDHPARDMQDTFYLSNDKLLRTHTSNVQVRVMEKYNPPIRVVAPGRCFRNETVSARSHVFFHQIEGFYVDENVTFADLLATMDEFWSKLFEQKIKTRYRPSYFPFVEPGMEGDISCIICEGKGCKICKNSGWLEVFGAGMIHPNVLKAGNVDPEKYTGYAWGLGIERLAMLYYGIKDIRLFTENDMRFLSQF